MRAPGEIAYLTEIARPEIGIITNVAAAHLETLGSIEGVARAKGELFAGLGPRATAVFPADDPLIVAQAAPVAPERRLTFGDQRQRRAGPRLRSGGRRRLGRPLFRPRDPRRGAAAARRGAQRPQRRRGAGGGRGGWCVAGRGGSRPRGGDLAAAPVGPRGGRRAHDPRRLLQRQPGLDERGARCAGGGRRRREAGSPSWATCWSSARGPRRRTGSWGARPAGAGAWPGLAAVGRFAPIVVSEARAAGLPAERAVVAASPESAAAVVASWTSAGDWILVKASRGLRLERAVEALRVALGPTTERGI